MTDPATISKLATEALAFLAPHTPWLADKLGGEALSQAVRETWDLVKHKLTSSQEGKEALHQLEAAPSPEAAVESLKPPLLAALQSDPDFAAQLSRLVIVGSDNQVAAGPGIKQAKVTGSSNVNISIG
jgi:hypothetical protein